MIKEKQEPKLPEKLFLQLFLALPVSLVVFFMVVFGLLVGFEVVYADRVYPGVYVHTMDLSGMTLQESKERLAEVLPYTYEGSLQLTYQDQVWEINPIDLGYLIDPTRSAQQALDVGRRGWLPTNLALKARAWFNGVQLSPVAYFDERIAMDYLQSIAASIDRPVEEASLGLENTNVVVTNGQVGREVDIPGTLSSISDTLSQMENTPIPLIVTETHPAILDVSAQAVLVREILSEPLVLTVPGDENNSGSWTIQPQELAGMLVIGPVEDAEAGNFTYQITLNEDAFRFYLNSLATGLSLEPVNPRFIFNDDTGLLEVLESAVIGRVLNFQSSIDHINEQLMDGNHEVALQFDTITPAVTDETLGQELGITELVHSETSYFYGSDPGRVQNIAASAARFHGLLIAPGETFSMVKALGNISLENGYAEAPIIYGGQTIQGVGGGVCQVSTTLFRAAFLAGFPIVERYAHSYRVRYYELEYGNVRNNNLAGLDATVYVPIVDLKFTNDTDHWLLMETYPTSVSLTWKFYSTDDGRTVNWNTTGLTNVIPAPETLYRENAELAKGETKRVDYAVDGADVRITRTVNKNGQVYFTDSFFTRYQAWQEIIEYGPGTEGIPDTD